MLEFLSTEKRRLLFKKKFIRDFLNGDDQDFESFAKAILAYKYELHNEGFTLE